MTHLADSAVLLEPGTVQTQAVETVLILSALRTAYHFDIHDTQAIRRAHHTALALTL
jgi:hypothetical protein